MIDSLPLATQEIVYQLSADLIEHAAAFGDYRWGLTPFTFGYRLNVGWTECLTVDEYRLRLIVIGASIPGVDLPGNVSVYTGKNPKGLYLTCPGSVEAAIPLSPVASLSKSIQKLRPALFEAASVMAQRRTAKGVRAGHKQSAVNVIEVFTGRALPAPSAEPYQPVINTEADSNLFEGALRRVASSVFERNPVARAACIAHFGTACSICNFSFEERFGEIGKGFIHVHHLVPLATRQSEYQVDPIRDLIPVCPNCHAMIHSSEDPIDVEHLRKLVERHR